MKFALAAITWASVALAAPVALPLAGTPSLQGRIDWISTDGQDRTVHCTANAGLAAIDPVDLPAGTTKTSYFPEHWIGNCWGVIKGHLNTGGGMLAEVNFDSWAGLSYFDVSQIVVPTDSQNVYAMTPGTTGLPMSGCWTGVGDGKCLHNTYVNPDDVQTKTTSENYFKVYLGPSGAQVSARSVEEAAPVSRTFVTGDNAALASRDAAVGRDFITGVATGNTSS